jgi:hypothetical protein
MSLPIKPWRGGVVLDETGGTYTITTKRAVIFPVVETPYSWTINLLTGTIDDGSFVFVSDFDGSGHITLVSDAPMFFPYASGSSTSALMKTSSSVGLVYVASAAGWYAVCFYPGS